MKTKSVEIIVREVIELDRRTDQELLDIEGEIEKRKEQVLEDLEQMKDEADQLQKEYGKRLYDEIVGGAVKEKEAFADEARKTIERMEDVFLREKESILTKAMQESVMGRWKS